MTDSPAAISAGGAKIGGRQIVAGVFTQAGIRKFAEIGSQPRAAASVTPFENGATAVTTIGGCGRCSGGHEALADIFDQGLCTEMFQYFPCRL